MAAAPSAAFVFSSRRRHTRSLRDWSSDVCSSDLRSLEENRELRRDHIAAFGERRRGLEQRRPPESAETLDEPAPRLHRRSEERRVGKESRTAGTAAIPTASARIAASGLRRTWAV